MAWILIIILVIIMLNIYFGGCFIKGYLLFLKDTVKQFYHRKIKKEIKPFDYYDVYLFCGRVGCGKTISMIEKANRIKQRYPKVKIYSNFDCDISDGKIEYWEQLRDLTNRDEMGNEQGILFLFDEIHLTFASEAWQAAPADLLSYISLQRKNKKCIFASSQVWTRVNKVIREQADYVIECKSFFKSRIVRNKYYLQEDYAVNGEQKDSGMRKRDVRLKYCFVATDKLRSLYDTNEIVRGLKQRKTR